MTRLCTPETINSLYKLTDQPAGRNWTLEESYQYCRNLTLSHYENFPVGSMLLPKAVRPHVYAIYAFARVSDDFADEAQYGEPAQRLALLEEWETQLHDCYRGKANHPIFIALADSVQKMDLPQSLLHDLLHAFKRDVTVNRYKTWDEVIEAYCRYSANPVGRLILHLFDYRDVERQHWSDCICTALQLTNFWQDVAIDLKKNRVYIPLQEMHQQKYSLEALFAEEYNEAYHQILENLAQRTWALFLEGYPLLDSVRFPLSAELRFTWMGGVTILSRTRDVKYNVFLQRPKLSKWDLLALGSRALFSIQGFRNQMQARF